MRGTSILSRLLVGTLLLAGLCGGTAAHADYWLSAAPGGQAVLLGSDQAAAPELNVLASDWTGLQVAASVDGLVLRQEKTAQGEFVTITWPEASVDGEIGAPALPVVRRLFVAPPGAGVSLQVQAGPAVTVTSAATGFELLAMPRQAPVPKLPGAREAAPFDMDAAAYAQAADLPAERVVMQELGLARGQRLFLLEMRPVAYNASARTLTWWPELTADIAFTGGSGQGSELSPPPGLRNHVLNPELLPATLRATGNYLIVVASAHQTTIAPFAAAKTAQGFTVSTWVPGSASNTVIKNYIQSLWGGAGAPDYVLLVGDTDTLPHWTGGGEGSPPTDLPYACMDGATDWYPDIALGRFPARTAAQLQAMIDKTLYYENGPLADPDYLKRAVFMASSDNYTVSEGTHNWVIQNYMAPNEIACDKLYCHTYNATTQQVRNAFNAGRFWGIYSGHGADTYWADGPVFYQSDVNGLTNVNMYPVVYSFACVTGNITVEECFMETWLRAPNKAGIIAIGSSVNSYWTEDDVIEKRLFDSIFDAEDTIPAEIGPVWNDTKMRYLAEMGSGATTRRYFEMYNIMGDPSLRYPGSCSDTGTIQLDRTKYGCYTDATITVTDCGLNLDDNLIETVQILVVSDAEPAGELVTLTETDSSSAEFSAQLPISTTNAAGVLLVAEGNLITATYQDADDGTGAPATVQATALVDCSAPGISNVHTTSIEPRAAVVAFDATEAARGIVHYGTNCGALNGVAVGTGYVLSPTVSLAGLTDNTTYFYSVEAEDEAGNTALDDNGGTCYSFTTPEVPDFFTELFESDNDLDNISLMFTPNGSNDFYAACAEPITALPTDPAGGTTLSLTDDSFATIAIGGGQSVQLYGSSYTSIYPASNGYICFVYGESGYSESLATHFTTPRIAGVFDDLNPSSGGSVSWKQLSDRVAVTWQGVVEYGTSNPNTFQIVMYFDGRLEINYLSVAVADGLAGLSAGGGVDPDFLESDLSALGACGPRPPTAQARSATTPASVATTITLSATDDDLPDPPAALTYVVSSLPAHGSLSDPQAGSIDSVPHTLANGGVQVVYEPVAGYQGQDTFQYLANDGGTPPEGGDSNIAVVTITVGGGAWNPVAHNVSFGTAVSQAVNVVLNGTDPNSDPLTYVVETLPAAGYLQDPNGGEITAVPYTLLAGGHVVVYQPPCGEVINGSFTYTVYDATAGSNVATATITVNSSGPRLVYNFPLDSNPGWAVEGAWAFGQPLGQGSHNRDPNSAHSGTAVYGYNLSGDYANSLPARYLTTTALNCSNMTATELRFWRWLGVEKFDRARVEASNDGSNWVLLWENSATTTLSESSWTQQIIDLSAVADGQSTVWVRWSMGPTDTSTTYPGWNLDDVEFWGIVPAVSSDFNGDGLVNATDLGLLVDCLNGPTELAAFECVCKDLDGDGDVDLADFAQFQAAFETQ